MRGRRAYPKRGLCTPTRAAPRSAMKASFIRLLKLLSRKDGFARTTVVTIQGQENHTVTSRPPTGATTNLPPKKAELCGGESFAKKRPWPRERSDLSITAQNRKSMGKTKGSTVEKPRERSSTLRIVRTNQRGKTKGAAANSAGKNQGIYIYHSVRPPCAAHDCDRNCKGVTKDYFRRPGKNTHCSPNGFDFKTDKALSPSLSIQVFCLICRENKLDDVMNCSLERECLLHPYRNFDHFMLTHFSRERLLTQREAILRYCLACVGANVADCEKHSCPLWPWRTRNCSKSNALLLPAIVRNTKKDKRLPRHVLSQKSCDKYYDRFRRSLDPGATERLAQRLGISSRHSSPRKQHCVTKKQLEECDQDIVCPPLANTQER